MRRSWVFIVMLTLLVLAVFAQVRGFDFLVYDDDAYVTANPHVQSGLTLEGIAWALRSGEVANWHPVTWISHMADCQWFGLRAGAHHLVNVAIHAANAILLFWFLCRVVRVSGFHGTDTDGHGRTRTNTDTRNPIPETRYPIPGFLAAALFAVHPLHVESVAWISERKDLLCAFFGLLALNGYARYVRRRTVANYLLVLVPFALGLMAKPMLVTLPFVLLLLDYWPLRRLQIADCGLQIARIHNPQSKIQDPRFASWPMLVLEKLPLLVFSFVSCLITIVVQRRGGTIQSFEAIPLYARAGNALVAYVLYLAKTVCPVRLAAYYPGSSSLLPWWQVLGAFFVLALITIVTVYHARRRPYALVGWLWFVGMLVPVSGIVQVGGQAMADRYTYLPLVGIFIAVCWGLHEHGRTRTRTDKHGRPQTPEIRNPKPALIAVGFGAVIVLAVLAHAQTGYWRDSRSLFEHALDVTRDNDVAHYNLGVLLKREGRIEEAALHFQDVLRIRPNEPDANYALGLLRYSMSRYDEAIVYYQAALKTPGHPNRARVMNNLGACYTAQNRRQLAFEHYAKALELDPGYADAHVNLGNWFLEANRRQDARAHYEAALRTDPGNAIARKGIEILSGRPG